MPSNGLLIQPDAAMMADAEHQFRLHMQTYGLLVGSSDWGASVSHTSFDSDSEYAHTIENNGTGGHLDIPGELQVESDGSGTFIDTATITVLNLAGNLTVPGNLTVNGNTTLGNAVGDTVTISGPVTVGAGLTAAGALEGASLEVNGDASIDNDLVVNRDLAVDRNLDVDGDSDLQLVRLTPDPTANPQLLFRANVSRTYWGLGASDSSAPNFQLFTLDGSLVATEQFEVTETGRVNAKSVEVYAGDLLVSAGSGTFSGGVSAGASSAFTGGVSVTTGGLEVLAGGLEVTGTSTFHDDAAFESPVTFTDTPQVVGTDLNLSTAYIDFDLGSTSGFVESNWDGYVEIKHDGAIKRVPYITP